MQLVFFLEEQSAKVMLEGLLPRLLPETVSFRCIAFEGKQDLEKQLPKKLKAWLAPDSHFVVLRDQDSGDCYQIKERLLDICHEAGKPNTLVRIACHELESWYLGDLNAVEKSIGPKGVSAKQLKRKYRNPDTLANASEELKKVSRQYQKIGGSRKIGKYLSLHDNTSTSFCMFVKGIGNVLSRNLV